MKHTGLHWMRRCLWVFVVVGLQTLPAAVFAWGSTGHQIVAMIAYQHLTPKAKAEVDNLTQVTSHTRSAMWRFLNAATMPDHIKFDGVKAFNQWHFIDLPYSPDGSNEAAVNPENVVWATRQAEQVLNSRKANRYEKGFFLAMLAHFVGDATQPLHCAVLFSHQHPQGDVGGNEYKIKTSWVSDLHGFWDQGLGLFRRQGNRRQYDHHLYQLVTSIEQQFPEKKLEPLMALDDPQVWAQQSHQYAVKFAYTVPENTVPSAAYIKKGQYIAEQQVALAGYRLAALLNNIFS